jgi:hypothetical protein
VVENVAVYDAFNWGTPERRAVHERLHRYHERREDGSYLLELWNRTGYERDLKQREVALRNLMAVNDDTGAEVYGTMGWEGAGPYAMCRQVIWDVTPRIQAPTLVMYPEGGELSRALDRFLETLPHGKGDGQAPSLRTDPDAVAKEAAAFYRSPGV